MAHEEFSFKENSKNPRYTVIPKKNTKSSICFTNFFFWSKFYQFQSPISSLQGKTQSPSPSSSPDLKDMKCQLNKRVKDMKVCLAVFMKCSQVQFGFSSIL